MKILLIICLAAGWAATEKLDRSYLPPPGSKFSGGSPGDIQVPLEFPKENYSTKRPQADGVPEIELGINRRPFPPGQGSTQRPDDFSYFQNSYKVPKTTTSYAITQTTTFPPEDYEGLDENSGFLNVSTGIQQPGRPQYPGQRQPMRGQSASKGVNYNQYQQGQNIPSTLTPYGSTTQNPRAYLPPVPSFNGKGQSPTGQVSYEENGGYPSGCPQGPKYQDGQRIPTGPGFIQGGNQNVFIGTPSTPAPQYEGGRYTSTTGPVNNQQRFGSRVPIEQGLPGFQEQTLPSSTAVPQYTTSEGQDYPDQKFPSSTSAPQYQYGQRITTPGSTQQGFVPRLPQQKQNKYPGSQNIPSSTSAPQYQDGQQYVTPGSVQNQYTGNQISPSTAAPQYQGNQRYTTPGSTKEGFVPNQQRFGSQIPIQGTQNQYNGNQNFQSSTALPQLQNGQQYTTPGAVQQNRYPGNQNYPSSTTLPQLQNGQRYTTSGEVQQNQYPENQNYPSSTAAPQYQNGQQYTTPGAVQQNRYPGNQNFPSSTAFPQLQNGQRYTTPGTLQQNQYPENQNYPSSTAAPQYQNGQRYTTPGSIQQEYQNQNQYPGNQFFPSTGVPQNKNGPQQVFGSPEYTQQGQNQYQENQNIPSSTGRPQYQNGQIVTPGFVQQNQYSANQNVPSTASPQIQNGQRFTTSGPQGVGPNQQVYPGSQVVNENGQQYPSSTSAPQYQSTLGPISGSTQGFLPNQQNINQPGRPGYSQQYPITVPQGSPQVQYGDDGKPISNTGVSYPAVQGTPNTQTSPAYGYQPTSPTGSPVYGTTPSAPGFTNQEVPIRPGSLDPVNGILGQNRPERPQAASDRTAEIISYENVLTPEGYSYSYDTSNGIHADETGVVGDGTKAQGGYSYIGDDGKVYSVVYSADENGFQPRGDHLPTPPPIPEAIQRVIEQANRDKEAGISDDGLYDEEKYGYMKYDGSSELFRPRNKTKTLVNGADIPNSYDSRIGGKIRNQMKNKGQKKPNIENEEDDDISEFENEEQINGENFDNGTVDDERRTSNKYPSGEKGIKKEGNRRKMQKGNISSNTDTNRKPMGEKSTDRRPISGQAKLDDDEENVSVTEIPDIDDDVDTSQEYDEESDLINYKDDPNTRKDFHGINRYLPNPKQYNKINQTDNNRVVIRPGGKKQKGTSVGKPNKTGNRKIQITEDTIAGSDSETEQEQSDRVPIPGRNKIGQKKMQILRKNQRKPMGSKSESGIYEDDDTKITEGNGSDDELASGEDDVLTGPGEYQSKQKTTGKPKQPFVNQRTGIPKNKNVKTVTEEETGYEYNPPERKFEPEGAIMLPSRTSATGKPQFPQKGSQTTVRPFMTPNVYGNDKTNENNDDQFDSEGKPYQTVRPTTPRDQNISENVQGNRYNGNLYPNENKNERYDATGRPIVPNGSTSSRRPFGRPTTAMPGYKDQGITTQDEYNGPINYQGSRRPVNTGIYSTNTPTKGVSEEESNAFVSTTPLPNSGNESYDKQRPGQYQDTNVSNDGSPQFEGTNPNQDGQKPNTYRTEPQTQVSSTTYRPNYNFGDRTVAPNGPIVVDGFGRPISSTNEPVTQDSRGENQPGKMQFKPNVGRFGVTSGPAKGTTYPGSTPGPVEDFSGPKQPQRFDPETGYHY